MSDVTGVNLYGMVAAVLTAEQSGGSGGERSDTKSERDHIVVCQTSAFLANPHTESLIIPSCCSPSLRLSLSLILIPPPPTSQGKLRPRLWALRPSQDQDRSASGPRQDQDQGNTRPTEEQTSDSPPLHDTLTLKCGLRKP